MPTKLVYKCFLEMEVWLKQQNAWFASRKHCSNPSITKKEEKEKKMFSVRIIVWAIVSLAVTSPVPKTSSDIMVTK
jgi:hypothetical protein